LTLEQKIANKSAKIAVIGVGYVGLPLAVAFAGVGFAVTGVDLDPRKIAAINRGASYIPDVPTETLAHLVHDYDILRDADVIFICVPTPVDKMKAPDLRPILSAAEGIAPRLHQGQLVILQSTTYPGTTEEVVLPILEKSGLHAGADFHLAFSQERIDPGPAYQEWNAQNTPKVLGGLTSRCTEIARQLLVHLTPQVHVVSSPRVAEMSKLLENTFRSVNIALVNEIALLCERMGIDTWEVIEAAKTKPFGYMPFYPGPGVGGHCIPVDPYYLSWKAREFDFYTRFIELAADINQGMPFHVVKMASALLNRAGKSVKGARILVLGVAFKRDIDDARNSPAGRVIELLLERGARVSYHDPYVPKFRVGDDVFHKDPTELTCLPLTEETLRGCDLAVIVTGHRAVDYRLVVEHAPLVVDTVNVTAAFARDNPRVVRLGTPHAADK
jgi:UDP-N-acetyl-D-glucosamine dehydrogenase